MNIARKGSNAQKRDEESKHQPPDGRSTGIHLRQSARALRLSRDTA